jgi:hypothetical protein
MFVTRISPHTLLSIDRYFQLPSISKVAALLGPLGKQNSGNLHCRFGFDRAEPFSGLDELAEAHHDDRNPEKS